MAPIEPDTPAALAAPVLLCESVREMCSRERHLIGPKQVAAVQQMRFDARLVRDSLSLFGQWLDPIVQQEIGQYAQSVARVLRPVRNADATMQFFRAFRRELQDEGQRRAIRRFVERVERVRGKRRKEMMATIEELYLKRLSSDVNAFVVIPDASESDLGPVFVRLATALVPERLRRCLCLKPDGLDTSDTKALRQAARDLRRAHCTLSVFSSAFGRSFRKIEKRLLGYHDLLAHVLDLDVFTEDIRLLSRRWEAKGRGPKSLLTLERLRARLIRQREDALETLVAHMRKQDGAVILEACRVSLGKVGADTNEDGNSRRDVR